MDNHQAVYDAVRSKISNGNIGEAVASVVREADISHYAGQISLAHQEAAAEQMRPCVMFRPKIYIDGNKWCALYGGNLQDGVAGFGNSPSDAMHDFDKNWHTNLAS